MDYEYSQRRRTFIAIALTVVLGPAAFLLTRGDDDPATMPVVTVIGTTPRERPAADAPTATDVMGTTPDVLETPAGDGTRDPATIAIPRMPQAIVGQATFSRDIAKSTSCQVASLDVPYSARVTVTNLDNSQSIDCINDVGGTRPTETIVLNAEAFSRIADLTDAPVPVQITW